MRRRAACLLFAAWVAGCSSPPVSLYTLAMVPGTPGAITASRVELRRVGLAGYLDRPEIVRSAADYRLQLNEQDRWGEPLGGMIGRVLTEDLLQRLPGTAVYSDTGAITARADLVLEVDVQRFDTDPDGAVVLVAQIGIRHDDGHGPTLAETLRVAVPAGGAGAAARADTGAQVGGQVGAMSVALGQFADQVASRLGAV